MSLLWPFKSFGQGTGYKVLYVSYYTADSFMLSFGTLR